MCSWTQSELNFYGVPFGMSNVVHCESYLGFSFRGTVFAGFFCGLVEAAFLAPLARKLVMLANAGALFPAKARRIIGMTPNFNVSAPPIFVTEFPNILGSLNIKLAAVVACLSHACSFCLLWRDTSSRYTVP